MVDSKAYDYMMSSLRRIISFVEEVSLDWWWLEQGRIPIVSVKRLVVSGDKIEFERLPKRSVIDALRVIEKNFNLLRELPKEKRVDYAVEIAQDLYATLQAVANIVDAHELAEKLVEIRNRISSLRPEVLDDFLAKINSVISALRETLVANVFRWPAEKERIKSRIEALISEANALLSATSRVVEEEKIGGEEVSA